MNDQQPYLWDRSAPVDADVRRLEELLGAFRLTSLPELALESKSERGAGRLRRILPALLAAAVILLAFVGRSLWTERGYRLTGCGSADFLAEGAWLETAAGDAPIELVIADVGSVELAGGARLRAERVNRGGEHRLFLERGSLSARIWSEPEVFGVGTPAGLSIDMGCEYTLDVDEAGVTDIAVTSGAVTFEGAGRFAYVPEGASCRATCDTGPSSAVPSDAGASLLDEVVRLEREPEPDSAEVRGLLERLDSLTLWHLLQARAPDVRVAARDQLARLVGMPAGIDREATAAGAGAEALAAREAWMKRMSWYLDPNTAKSKKKKQRRQNE